MQGRSLMVAMALLLVPISAQADVKLTLEVEGYDDFFKRCKAKVLIAPSADIDDASVIYRVRIPGKGGSICYQDDSSRSCQGTNDFEYTCDDMQSLEILSVDCRDAGGARMSCGPASLGQTVGDDIEMSLPDGSAGDAATKVFAAVLGDDDFFDSCKIGTGISTSADIDSAEIGFRIDVGDMGYSNCTGSTSGGVSTGLSCSSSGSFDYTCADVTAVTVNAVTCEKDDAEVDCGPIGLTTPDPDLIKSGLK